MGPEIIPAILAKDEKEFRRKIEMVTDLCDTVQIDVMDGKFVNNTTFADPQEIERMNLPMEFEIHLMVEDPEAHLDAWSVAGCSRALVHAESVEDLRAALESVHAYGMERGISINPQTPIEDIEDAIDLADVVQVMGVQPGFMGQEFVPETVAKVAALRDKYPDLVIEVDGGVSDKTAADLADAGADRLVSGSFIFSGAPAKAIETLVQLTEYEEEA